MEGTRKPPAPLWAHVYVGWLLTAAWAIDGGRARCAVAARALRPVSEMAPRELRALPGIGETRALTIARARWAHGRAGPLLLSDLSGIGAATEARARAWLVERALLAPISAAESPLRRP